MELFSIRIQRTFQLVSTVYNVITYFSESKVTVDFFAQRFFFAKRTKKL